MCIRVGYYLLSALCILSSWVALTLSQLAELRAFMALIHFPICISEEITTAIRVVTDSLHALRETIVILPARRVSPSSDMHNSIRTSSYCVQRPIFE